MPLIMLLLFVVVPIVELYVIVQVGQTIGVLETIALVIVMSAAGAWLMKREGAKAWRAFALATQEGRIPAREVADGVLILFGGALLLTPGFLTDVVGLLLILPPTRALLRRGLTRFVAEKFVVVRMGQGAAQRAAQRYGSRHQARGTAGTVIDGETVAPPGAGEGQET